MSEQERLDVLRAVGELSSISGPNLRSLLRFFDEVQVPAGVALAVEGRLCHEFFVVASGDVEVCRRGRASRLGRGDAFGWREMRDRGRYDASLLTLAPTRLLVMGHAQFRAAEAAATLSSVHSGLISEPQSDPERTLGESPAQNQSRLAAGPPSSSVRPLPRRHA